MKNIIFATNNEGKAVELRKLLAPLGINVQTLFDFQNISEIEETGKTFEENALLKARTLAKLLNMPALADDSGLIVDALNGQPGVFSARYSGTPKNDERNYKKVLFELKNVPFEERTARFVCVMAFVFPKKFEITSSGVVEGRIVFEPTGNNGFGYDPIFWVNELKKTFAECSMEEKNSFSHRKRALDSMLVKLKLEMR